MGLYKRILHMRPVAIAQAELEDGGTEMTFNCTDFQVKSYFRRFGAEAVVVEPYRLAKEIRDEYEAALLAYDEGV